MPAGTIQSQLPTVTKVKIVTPSFVSLLVGLHAAALAVTGIETNRPEIKVVRTIEAIFGRAEPTFMRANPKITFTSLLE
jgi:hypothetical protein